MRVITNGAAWPVQPKHIDVSKRFYGAFENLGWEHTANWIVRLCQQLGTWQAFTAEQMQRYYETNGGNDAFPLSEKYGLVTYGFIVCKDGEYYVTEEFVGRCFLASPARPE